MCILWLSTIIAAIGVLTVCTRVQCLFLPIDLKPSNTSTTKITLCNKLTSIPNVWPNVLFMSKRRLLLRACMDNRNDNVNNILVYNPTPSTSTDVPNLTLVPTYMSGSTENDNKQEQDASAETETKSNKTISEERVSQETQGESTEYDVTVDGSGDDPEQEASTKT